MMSKVIGAIPQRYGEDDCPTLSELLKSLKSKEDVSIAAVFRSQFETPIKPKEKKQ